MHSAFRALAGSTRLRRALKDVEGAAAGVGIVAVESDGAVGVGEGLEEGFADGGLPGVGELRGVALEVEDAVGDLDTEGCGGGVEGFGEEAGRGVGVEVEGDQDGGVGEICRGDGGGEIVGFPDGDEAVGGEAGVEDVGAGAVHVGDEAGAGCAEDGEVEVGVAGLHGVEGPGDEWEAGGGGPVALGVFEAEAEALALEFGDDAGELGVEAEAAIDPAEEGEGEGDGLAIGQEGAEDEAAVELAPAMVATGTR